MKTDTSNEEKQYVVMAYLSGGGTWMAKDIDISKLTHINYAFAEISNGKISGGNKQKLNELRKLKALKPSLRILISIGGWMADGFSDAVLTSESRELFLDSLIYFVVENGFDGVDLDWEYPCIPHGGITARPEDKYNYTLMVEGLRNRLNELGSRDGRQYLVTMAMGSGQLYVDTIEMERLKRCLDFINIMTYDFCSGCNPRTGHHSSLYSSLAAPDTMSADKAVSILLNAGILSEKIVLGVAFYGRGWSTVQNNSNGLCQPAGGEGVDGGAYTYSQITAKYLNKNGFTRFWDDDAKAPYLFDGNMFITYEDEESIGHKTRYIIEKELAGAMFWEYTQDKDGKLLNKVYEGLE